MPLAEAVRTRVDGANGTLPAWFLDYDVSEDGMTGVFDASQSVLPDGTALSGDLVLLFDWSPESNEASAGWSDAAGESLFTMLAGLGIVNPALGADSTVPLHFIAHGSGTVVTSDAIERLARFQVPVDQVTYLDPHDFDQNIDVDGAQQHFTVGQPIGYGATVWDNVGFADVYYQTDVSPAGRPIPGAYSVFINDLVSGTDADSDVWSEYYQGSVTNTASTTGYAFSRIARNQAGAAAVARPAGNFFAAGQDHEHTPENLVNQTDNGFEPDAAGLQAISPTEARRNTASTNDQLTADNLVNGKWRPVWNPTTIANGMLKYGGDENDGVPGGSNLAPGWSHHGGGGSAELVENAASFFAIELTEEHDWRQHNRFYVATNISELSFDANVPNFSTATLTNQLIVRIETSDGGTKQTTQQTFNLDQTTVGDDHAFKGIINIPENQRNRVNTVMFELISQGGPLDATVQIHEVRLSRQSTIISGPFVIDGSNVLEYAGDVVFDVTSDVTGLADAVPDELILDVAGTVTFAGQISGLRRLIVRSTSNISVQGSALLLLSGGDLGFQIVGDDSKSITIGSGATISTRMIADGGNPTTAASTGASGDILLTADTINVGASSLLAHVETGSSFTAGNVTLKAEDIGYRIYASPVGFTHQTTNITLDGTTIRGGDITIQASSQDESMLSEVPALIDEFLGPLVDLFEKLPGVIVSGLTGISASVIMRGADATVSLNNSGIVSSGKVTLASAALASAPTTAITVGTGVTPFGIAVGYGQAKSNANVSLTGTTAITAAGDVVVLSNAKSHSDVVARTSANLGYLGGSGNQKIAISVAIANTELDSHATVGAGTSITSQTGNVTVDAKGDTRNFPYAKSGLYYSGLAGVTIATGFDEACVDATVNGTVNAVGRDDTLTLNPATAGVVNTATNRITLPNHGLRDNETITYRTGGGAPIGGLVDGRKYTVTVIDANTIQLSAGAHLTLDAASADPVAVHSLGQLLSKNFTPSAANLDLNRIVIPNHGFTNGQRLTYIVADDAPAINGLVDATEYLVDSVDVNSFRLRLATDNSLVDLLPTAEGEPAPSVLHALIYERPINFTPSRAVHSANGTITLTNHGLEAGDAVVYHVDPSRRRTEGTRQIGDTPIVGLMDGETYYVVVVDANTIRLTESELEAAEAAAIDLTNGASGTAHTLERALDGKGGIAVRADLVARNIARTGTQTGDEPSWTEISTPEVGVAKLLGKTSLLSFAKNQTTASDNAKNSEFSGAASVAIVKLEHDVKAVVGPQADLNSDTDVTITSHIKQNVMVMSEGKSSKPQGSGGVVISAAVGVGLYDNDSRAIISGGASVDAKRNLRVASDIEYPLPKLFTDPVDALSDSAGALSDSVSTLSNPKAAVEVLFTGPIKGLGLNLNFVSSTATGDGSVSIGGAVGVSDFKNYSEAVIESGALINQEAALQTTAQKVDVAATTTMIIIGYSGGGADATNPDASDPGKDAKLLAKIKSKTKDAWKRVKGESAKSAKGGVGGSLQLTFVENTTRAHIGDAAVRVGSGGGLNVTANEDLFQLTVAISGSNSSTFGLSGSVVVGVQDSTTHASLGSGVSIIGGPIVVKADNRSRRFNVAGAIVSGNGSGIGAGIVVDTVERDTAAFIGAASGQAAGSAGTNINAGNLTLSATNDGFVYSFAVAAAKLSQDESIGGDTKDTATDTASADAKADSKKASSNDKGSKGKYGVGISGSVTVHTITDNTRAFINDTGTINAGIVTLTSTNDTSVIGFSGAGALVKKESSAGIAGAWAHSVLRGTTEAFVNGATLTASSLSVTAKRNGDLFSLAAGLAGAPRMNGIAIAGSVAVGDIEETVDAAITNAAVTITLGDLILDAINETDIVSVAGAVAYGGRAGVGAGVSVNLIENTTKARLINTVLVHAGLLSVKAKTDGDIFSLAGAIGASKGTLGAAGTVTDNDVENTTEALIVGVSRPVGAAVDGATIVAAIDNTHILSISGAIGIGKTAGLGAAVAYNDVKNTTRAKIDNSTINSNGAVSVIATASSLIESAAVGVGGGKSLGLGGSVAIDFVDNLTEALIVGGANVTGTAVTVSTGDGVAGAFNPANAVSSNEINLGFTHGLQAGDAVVYHMGPGNSKEIGGLTDGETYYVIPVTGQPSRVKLAKTKDEAKAGTAIALNASAAQGSAHRLGQSGIKSLSGGLAGAGSAAIGAAVAINEVGGTSRAAVEGSTVTTTSNGDVNLASGSQALIYSLTIGGAGAATFALGGSVSINTISTTLDTHISGGSTVTGGDINLSAANDSTLGVIAGGVAGAGTVATGAAVAVNEISNITQAFTSASTLNAGSNSITIDAATNSDILAIAFGAAGAGTFALGGSVSLNQLANRTTAHATGGSLAAGASVRIAAYNDASILNIAGGLFVGGKAGVGMGSATVVSNDVTEAFVGANTTINAKGAGPSLAVRDGQLDANGNPTTTIVHGLGIVAVTTEDILSVAAGGAGGGLAGVAGSVSLNLLNQTTRAHIDAGAQINNSNAGAATDQQVRVAAADLTKIFGIGGALGGGGTVGIGAGVDLALITKTTEAWIAAQANVASNGNVVIDAKSQEDVTSISASLGAGGTVGIAGSAGVSVFNITTRAFVEGTGTAANGAVINAEGNVVVSAIENSDLDIISGTISAAGGVSVGASASVPVITKLTDAFIGQNATVNAKANRAASNVVTGSFSVSFVTDTASESRPTSTGNSGRVSGTNLELGARGGSSKDVSSDGSNDLIDSSFTQQRVATPGTSPIKGVAVSAVNRDNIETIGASAGLAGSVAVNIGGSVNVMNVTTKAHVDPDAKLNHDQTGASGEQDVSVAAGNDYCHMGIAAAVSLSGAVSVAPGADVTIATFNTSAFIDDGADVRALRNVSVVATSQEDILSIAAGASVSGVAAVAGSAAVNVLNSTTKTYIGEDATTDALGAKVTAGGNVLVSAKDTTDLDVIAGSAGISGTVGVGISGAVSVLTKNTSAFIGDHASVDGNANDGTLTVFSGTNTDASHKTTLQGVAVQAFSSENILSVGAAGGVGGVVGAAGGIGVQVIDSNTTAFVGNGADVNQNNSSANAVQSVNVSAVNEFTTLGFGGAVGAGTAGGGAGIDVGIVRNDTTAYLGTTSNVSAKNDVEVHALADREVQTYAVSGALGGGVATGSVSVWSIGGALSSSYSVDGKSEDGLNVQSGLNPLSKSDSFAGSNDSQHGYAAMLSGHKSGKTFTASSATSTANDTITVGANHGFNDGEAVVYRTNGGAAIGGLTDGTTYYVIKSGTDKVKLAARRSDALAGNAINLTSSGSGNPSLTPLVTSGTISASNSASNGVGSNVVTSATSASTQSGTTAFIANGATVEAGDDVNVRADESVNFKVLVGSISAGGGAVGASIAVVTIGTKSEAYIDNGATVRAGTSTNGDINVRATFSDNIHARSYAGSFTVAVGLGAQVLVVNDHSSQFAYIDSGANINRAGGTVSVVADADRVHDVQAIGGNLSLGAAAGAAIVYADIDGSTVADVRGANIGQQSGQTVRNLTVTADADNRVTAQAIAANAGLFAGITGAYADARVRPTITASIGNNSEITLTGDLTVEALSRGSASADAIGAAASLMAAAGASYSNAAITPTLNTTVGTNATINAANVTLRALHNVTTTGQRLDQRAQARSINAAVALIGGASGADANADSSPNLTTKVNSGANIQAAGNVKLWSATNNVAEADTTGVGAGLGGGFGVGLADATIGGSSRAKVIGATINAAGDVEVFGESFNNANADVLAVGGGLVAGFSVNFAFARINPTVEASITGTSNIDAGDDVFVTARSEGNAFAKGAGVSAAVGVSIGTTKAEAVMTPHVFTQIGSGTTIDAGDLLTIQALHNISSNGTVLAKKAQATGNASGGGIAAGTGADIDATASAKTDAAVNFGATLRSISGVISVQARARNDADADGTGVVGGLLGLGAVFVDANASGSNGSTQARMEGAVTGGGGLTVLTQASNSADANSSASSGGLAAANVTRANATASPIIVSQIGNGTNGSTVQVNGNVSVMTVSDTSTNAIASGISGGLLGVGSVNSTATMAPDIDTRINANSNVTATGGDISLATFHNQKDQRANAETDAASGGVAAGTATQAIATANADVQTFAAGNVTLNAGRDVGLLTFSSNNANARADGDTGGALAVGSVQSTANSHGNSQADLRGINSLTAGRNVSLISRGTTDGNAYADASGGGVVDIAGSLATSNSTPRSEASVGSSGTIQAAGSISVIATALGNSRSTADGAGGGVVSVGSSKAVSNWRPDVDVSVASNTRLTAGDDITLVGYNNFTEYGQIDTSRVVSGSATTTGGGLASIRGADVVIDVNAAVDTHIGSGAILTLGDDLTVVARSRNNVDAEGYGTSGGLVSSGSTLVSATMANRAIAVTDNSSSGNRTQINGGTDLLFTATTDDVAFVDVVGGAGGLLGLGSAVAKIAMNNPIAQARLGDFTLVNSPLANLTLSTLLSSNLNVTTTQSVVGGITNNETLSEAKVNNGQSLADLGNNVTVTVQNLTMTSDAWQDVETDATADTPFGIIGFNKAAATSVVVLDSFAKIGSGTVVNAGNAVSLNAKADQIKTDSHPLAKTTGLTGLVKSYATSTRDVDADVTTSGGSTINTQELRVNATLPHLENHRIEDPAFEVETFLTQVVKAVVDIIMVAATEVASAFDDFGDAAADFFGAPRLGRPLSKAVQVIRYVVEEEILSAESDPRSLGSDRMSNDIILNSTINLGASTSPDIEINAAGVVTKLTNASLSNGTRNLAVGETITTGQAIVNDLANTARGTVALTASGGTVSGNSTWNFNVAFPRVDITNLSAIPLTVGNIGVVNVSADKPVIQVVTKEFGDTLNRAINTNATDAVVNILASGTGDLTLSGHINNLNGSTFVTHAGGGGDIFAGPSAKISSRLHDISSSFGQVGTASQRLPVLLPSSSSLTTRIDRIAGRNGVFATVTVVGGVSQTSLTGDLRNVSSTLGDVDLLIHDGQRKTSSGFETVPTTIRVSGISAGNDVLISATDSTSSAVDIEVAGTITATDNVTITTTDGGQVIDGRSAAGADITANTAVFIAGAGIGSSTNSLDVALNNLEADAGAGGLFVSDTGGLTIGGVSGTVGLRAGNDRTDTHTIFISTPIFFFGIPISSVLQRKDVAVTVAGGINVTTTGSLTVGENIVSDGSITLTTTETGGSDHLTINNQATVRSATRSVTLTAADNLTVSGGGSVAAAVDATLRAFDDIELQAGTRVIADDEVLVAVDDSVGSTVTIAGTLTAATAARVSGGAGLDRLIVPVSLGTVANETTWNITSNNTGNVGGTYLFSNFENLRGGNQKDHFVFANGATISGQVDGLSGNDTEDYSSYATAVTVNLTTGVNPGGGTVANVERIIGGEGNDRLTGNSLANWLIGRGGNDTISGNGGDDVLIGDSANIRSNSGVVTQITTQTDSTGNDSITSGLGNSVLIGGGGSDTINTGSGRNVVFGDHGSIKFAGGLATSITSTQAGVGAADTITVAGGRNVVVAGVGADTITATAGSNVLIGDDATVTFSGEFASSAISRHSTGAAGDLITGGTSDDVIVGGAGNDTISTGNGANSVLGDFGDVAFALGLAQTMVSADSTQFGNDAITTGTGNDAVVAGNGSDTITDNGGRNAIVSDQGRVELAGLLLTLVASDPVPGGASDTVTSGGDDDVIVTGGLGDSINAGGGADIVISDYGTVTLVEGSARSATSLDPNEGGNDTIDAGAGNDVVIAGAGNDAVSSASGNNVFLGDRGTVTWSAAGMTGIVAAISLTSGKDSLTGGGGNDVIVAGEGNDTVTGSGGTDIIAGDVAELTLAAGVIVSMNATQADAVGGNDTITTTGGTSIAVGGAGADAITAFVSVGDLATVTWSGGVISQVVTTATASGSGDTLTGGSAADVLIGGSGNDTVNAGDGDNFVLSDDGTVTFSGGVATALIVSEGVQDAADRVTTGTGNDVIATGGGDDNVSSGSGNDQVDAGSGSDTVTAGDGDDFVIGGLGNDSLVGGNGNDVIFGGVAVGTTTDYVLGTGDFVTAPQFAASEASFATGYVASINVTPAITNGLTIDGATNDGDDIITGDAGNDVLFGGAGVDQVSGGEDADYLDAGSGNDVNVSGGTGDDVVRGGAGDDVVHGDGGIDQLFGDNGDDKLFGDAGGAGQRLYGGKGRDELFAYAAAAAMTTSTAIHSRPTTRTTRKRRRLAATTRFGRAAATIKSSAAVVPI